MLLSSSRGRLSRDAALVRCRGSLSLSLSLSLSAASTVRDWDERWCSGIAKDFPSFESPQYLESNVCVSRHALPKKTKFPQSSPLTLRRSPRGPPGRRPQPRGPRPSLRRDRRAVLQTLDALPSCIFFNTPPKARALCHTDAHLLGLGAKSRPKPRKARSALSRVTHRGDRPAIGAQVARLRRPRSLVFGFWRLDRPHGDGSRLFPGDVKRIWKIQ